MATIGLSSYRKTNHLPVGGRRTGALSEVTVRVTSGDIKIAAALPPQDTASRGGGD